VADGLPPALPAELRKLFSDGGMGRSLTVPLPTGRLVAPVPLAGNDAVPPAYWLSDAPVSASLWARLRAEHHRSGLWPLLLQGSHWDPRQPWVTGEVRPEPVSDIDGHDAGRFLAQVWADWAEPQEGEEDLEYDFEDLAPFRRDWPGLAGPGEPMEASDVVADWYAGIVDDGNSRLGLVAVDRSADALVVIGWWGATNHSHQIAPLAAVVRSWEDRFGVRVVRVGADTLELSVAAPPVTTEHALRVAAEHNAFCPDNINQNSADFSRNTLIAYAEQILGKNSWGFWWD
jgi:Domain of unknown function (DUF4253)